MLSALWLPKEKEYVYEKGKVVNVMAQARPKEAENKKEGKENEDLLSKLKASRKKNKEVAAWLYLPGLKLDDPLLQSKDNRKYLRRRADSGKYDLWGSYFFSAENYLSAKGPLDQVTVIYGHASLDDDPNQAKFSQLKHYKEAEFAQKNAKLTLVFPQARLEYQIFAALNIPVTLDFTDPLPSEANFKRLVAYFKAHSYFKMKDVTSKDKILLLVTCLKDRNQRFLLCAKECPL